MSSATSLADRRRAEIEAKRSKLAALKKQREERTRQASRHDRLASVSLHPTLLLVASLGVLQELTVATAADNTRSAGYR